MIGSIRRVSCVLALLAPICWTTAASAGGPLPSVEDRSAAATHDGTPFGSVVVTTDDSARGLRSLYRPAGGTEADRLGIGGTLADFDVPAMGGYAFMAWVKLPSGPPAIGQGVITLGACCDPRDGYTLGIEGDGTVRFWGGATPDNGASDENFNIYGTVDVADGDWHHIGARANEMGIQLLIDGAPDGVEASNVPSSPSQAGSTNDASAFFPSVAGEGVDDPDFGAEILIDEVRVYGSYLDDPAWERAMAGAGQPDRLYYDFEVVVQEPTPQNAWRCFKAGTPKGAPKFPGASGELDNVVETKQTDIGKPRSVCVPTARDGSPIPDDSVSLVCYQAKDAKTSPPQSKFQKLVQVLSNPLGAAQSLELKKADVYCEPSTLVMP
jgi:hypothetical protein